MKNTVLLSCVAIGTLDKIASLTETALTGVASHAVQNQRTDMVCGCGKVKPLLAR